MPRISSPVTALVPRSFFLVAILMDLPIFVSAMVATMVARAVETLALVLVEVHLLIPMLVST
jgi:hypothetical protein